MGYISRLIRERNNEKILNASKTAIAFAEENNIDLSLVTGSGKQGQVTIKDVKSFIEPKK